MSVGGFSEKTTTYSSAKPPTWFSTRNVQDHNSSKTPSQNLFVPTISYRKLKCIRELHWDSRVNKPQGDVPVFLPDRGVTQETVVDPESHSRFHPTQKHFRASNCLRETAYVRPVICARLKNSPAIFTDFIRTSPRSRTGKQQAFKRKTMGRVMWWSWKHRNADQLFSFNHSCCSTIENYSSCILTKAERWNLQHQQVLFFNWG